MNEQEQANKKYPFNGAQCDKEACALYVEFGQRLGVVQRKMGMCVFVGSNIILSEMNMQLQRQGKPPVSQFQIPHLGRGKTTLCLR